VLADRPGGGRIGQTSNVATIAQDDQLDDEIILGREIKGQDEWLRQTTLVKISINLGIYNKAVVMLHHFCDHDRQFFADNIPLRPAPDGRFAQ
jgi:hypothetical protein